MSDARRRLHASEADHAPQSGAFERRAAGSTSDAEADLVALPADVFLTERRRALLARHGATERAREVHFVRTRDGWHLALSRYGERPTRRHPVLLVPGLAANRFSWDLDAERSVAAHLAGLGFDVFVLELRGHGRSEHPRRRVTLPAELERRGRAQSRGAARSWDWGFHDYVREDVDAALGAVRVLSGAAAVHGVGHSMGGMSLAMRAAARDPRLKSLATIASALDYSGTKSIFHVAKRFTWAARILPHVPLGPIASKLSPVALSMKNPIDAVNVWYANIEVERYRRLVALGFHVIPSPVLTDLAAAFDAPGLADEAGPSVPRLPGTYPVLSIAGTRDVQCAPDAAARHAGGEAVAFGRAHGHREEYGHFDLLVGTHAPAEVWPVLAEWLTSND
ncbi:MAG: alpha/beta fold hydrolase [Myxococcales bacterium]|nr:alpha/beta fold hydrolase [Myxococcales bacterium]